MKIFQVIIIGLLVVGCQENNADQNVVEEKASFNQDLADELERMAEIDQIAAYIPQGKYQEMSSEEWKSFKDSVFTTHQIRLKQIFDQHGFVGFDEAGEEGSQNFWLMVQHCDHVPEFQKKVLKQMKIEIEKGNAKSTNYCLLVDRVKLNTGENQVYGTQVTYNMNTCQAYPKSLEDSVNVNERRKSVGLEPIEDYLNRMSTNHFDMNKEFYLQKGVTEPELYELETVANEQ